MFSKRYYDKSKSPQPLDDKKLNELYRYLNVVPSHLAVFKILIDCEWHDVEDIYRKIKEINNESKITRTAIAIILSELQKILTIDLLEHKTGVLTYLWRLNPLFREFFNNILKELDHQFTSSLKRKYYL